MTIIASTSVSLTRDSTAPALAWMRSEWPATSTSPCRPLKMPSRMTASSASPSTRSMKTMNSSPPKRLTLMRSVGEGGELLGHGVDQAVADRMAERVVDALEIVEVEDDQRAAAVVVAGRPSSR